jgi:hypothetical protein
MRLPTIITLSKKATTRSLESERTINQPIAREVPIVALPPAAAQPDSSRLSRPPAAPQLPARKKRKHRTKKQHVRSPARPEVKEQPALPTFVPPAAPKPQPADPPEQSEEETPRIRLRFEQDAKGVTPAEDTPFEDSWACHPGLLATSSHKRESG